MFIIRGIYFHTRINFQEVAQAVGVIAVPVGDDDEVLAGEVNA